MINTHCFLWHFVNGERLSENARAVLATQARTFGFSTASMWEIVVKERIGKLRLPEPIDVFFDTRIAALGCTVLTIEQPHVRMLTTLEMHHRDPFDRILVAQTKHEQMVLITADDRLRAYGVPVLWD